MKSFLTIIFAGLCCFSLMLLWPQTAPVESAPANAGAITASR